MNTETLDRLEALLEKADILPLEYGSDEYDDWGTIRAGRIGLHGKRYQLCQTRQPYANDEAKSAHRKAGTDPYEDSARLLVEALNALPELISIARRAADVEGMANVLVRWIDDPWTTIPVGSTATAISRHILGDAV